MVDEYPGLSRNTCGRDGRFGVEASAGRWFRCGTAGRWKCDKQRKPGHMKSSDSFGYFSIKKSDIKAMFLAN